MSLNCHNNFLITHTIRDREKNAIKGERMETLLSSLGPTTSTLAEDLLTNASTEYLLTTILTTCAESSSDCVIDHSVVCVGEPEYCNLTRDEYEELLYDYISPTTPEWILIFSHIIVFLMGLVSQLRQNFYLMSIIY